MKELHAFLADYLVEISVGHTHIFAEAKGSGPCLSKQVLSIFATFFFGLQINIFFLEFL